MTVYEFVLFDKNDFTHHTSNIGIPITCTVIANFHNSKPEGDRNITKFEPRITLFGLL